MSSGIPRKPAPTGGFPLGRGEMARLIRAFDWAATPLGPIDDWPQSLRLPVQLMLDSEATMALAWGKELILLYNDAYSRLIGAHAPMALGRPVFETLPELRALLEPQLAQAMAGKAVEVSDQPYPFVQNTVPEQAWFDVSHNPTRGEDGRVCGILTILTETTRRVEAERRREAAELVLRESEAKYRSLFDSIDEGFCVVEVLFDADGNPVDYVFLETNAAFQRLTGLGDAIGRRMREMAPDHEQHWFDSYGRIAITGEPQRFDQPAEALGRWYDVYAFRVGNPEQRHVAILFTDIGERKRAEAALRESEERQGFLLQLSDALQPLADAAEIQATTARLLGEYLAVDRAMYAEVDGQPGAESGIIRGQYVRPSTGDAPSPAPFPDRFAYEPFGAHTMAARYRGEPLVVADVASDAAFSDAERAAWAAAGVCAAVVAPLAKGRLVAEFGVHCATPRAWTKAEVSLVREVGERTWAAVERARAEAALRRSEEKYRTIFDSIDEGFALIEVILDDEGKPVDLLHLETNPAYERNTGLRNVVGKRALEIAPDFDGMWFDLYGKVARTGEAARTESLIPPVDRWITLHASRVGGEGSRKIAVVFNDITERKDAEAALRESEERQTFLLKLSDALRAEPGADAMASLALRTLAERLRLDRCYIAEYHLDEDRGDLPYQVGNDRVPPLPASIRLSDFPEALEIAIGGTLVIDNVGEAGFLSDVDKRNMQGLGMGALVTAAARKGENLPIFTIVAVSATPRDWTLGEIALIEEVNERTWAALERARTETALAISEEKYRSLFQTMGQGFVECEIVRDDTGKAVDYRFLAINPAFQRLTKLDVAGALGRTAREVFPKVEDWWIEAFDSVVRSGAQKRVENENADIGSWFEANIYPAEGERFIVLYEDITVRKRAERVLRESEERQAFLLELSDALRPLADPVAVMSAASEALGRHLGVGRCGYGEVDATGEFFIVERDWTDGVMASFKGRHRLVSFGPEFTAAYRAGRSVLIDDALADARAAGAEAAFEAAGGVRASLGLPLIKEGRFVAGLFAQQLSPRRWSAEDEALARDVAERTWAEVVRARAEGKLRESDERFRRFGEASSDVLWIRNAETLQWEYLTPAFETIYGEKREVALQGNDLRGWAEMILPEDREHALANIRRVRGGERVTFEYRVKRPSDGEVRWLRNTDFPILDQTGRVVRIGGIGQDVTEEKRTANRLQVLVAELQHRTRNLISVVRSLSERTLASSASLQDFRDRFGDRLAALSRVNSMLSRLDEGRRVTFDEVLRSELEAHGAIDEQGHGRQVTLDGPAGIQLRSATVQTFALALHELGTNAAKYGALASPDGHLSVHWRVETDGDGEPQLQVDWQESGVADMPAAGEPPRGSGYGRELIEKALPYQLEASTSFELGANGVHCRIVLPLRG